MGVWTIVTLTVTTVLMAVILSQSLVLEGVDDFEAELDELEPVGATREAKSYFTVKVENNDCSGSNLNGTCMTSKTCKERRGKRLGTCSNGYGVCCQIVANCTGDGACPIRFNGTRIIHMAAQTGNWQYNILRPTGVSQVVVDFQQTLLAGAEEGDQRGECVVDRVLISNSITANPQVCGDMKNQKLYLDYGDSDRIVMNLRKSSTMNTNVDIKINYVRTRDRKVPSHCLQYYTDRDLLIRSFGYPVQLNNQRYTICMQSSSMADIMKLTPCTPTESGGRLPFAVSADIATPFTPPWPVPLTGDSDCLAERDWIQVFGQNRLCGYAVPNNIIQSTVQPFMMHVNFNGNENVIPAAFMPGTTVPSVPPIVPSSGPCIALTCYNFVGIIDPIDIQVGEIPLFPHENNKVCAYRPVDFTHQQAVGCRPEIVQNTGDFSNTGFCFKYSRA